MSFTSILKFYSSIVPYQQHPGRLFLACILFINITLYTQDIDSVVVIAKIDLASKFSNILCKPIFDLFWPDMTSNGLQEEKCMHYVFAYGNLVTSCDLSCT